MSGNRTFTFDEKYKHSNKNSPYGSTEFHTVRTISASSAADAKSKIRELETRSGHKVTSLKSKP